MIISIVLGPSRGIRTRDRRVAAYRIPDSATAALDSKDGAEPASLSRAFHDWIAAVQNGEMKNKGGVDPNLLYAWLSARSLARGLPAPNREYGGFRVDTNSDVEIARWVFPKMGPGLKTFARSIDKPRYFLKLCGTADELQAALPIGWQLHAPRYFMQGRCEPTGEDMPARYRIETIRDGGITEARIFSDMGALAAKGYAVETPDVFVYDRISTEPEHRRQGLARAIMATLRKGKQHPETPELLVATEDGRALFTALGWVAISPYSTASLSVPRHRSLVEPSASRSDREGEFTIGLVLRGRSQLFAGCPEWLNSRGEGGRLPFGAGLYCARLPRPLRDRAHQAPRNLDLRPSFRPLRGDDP